MLSITHHHVAIGDTELHYAAAGDAGSPVLLVHGFPETWTAFRDVLPRLAERHRVVAVDLRGFGESSADGEAFDSATTARDLQALIAHLGLGPVHVVGQDVSGMTTFRLAAVDPGSVRSLTGIETALPGFGGEALADVTRGGAWYIGALLAPGVPELLLAGRERAFVQQLLPAGADIDAIAATYARPGGWRGAIGQYGSLLHDGEELRALAAQGPLPMPVLAVGASAGPFVHQGLGAATGADVRDMRLEGVGHYAAMEAPDRVAGALLAFFAEADG